MPTWIWVAVARRTTLLKTKKMKFQWCTPVSIETIVISTTATTSAGHKWKWYNYYHQCKLHKIYIIHTHSVRWINFDGVLFFSCAYLMLENVLSRKSSFHNQPPPPSSLLHFISFFYFFYFFILLLPHRCVDFYYWRYIRLSVLWLNIKQ